MNWEHYSGGSINDSYERSRKKAVWQHIDKDLAIKAEEGTNILKVLVDEFKNAKDENQREKIKKMIIDRFGFNVE